MAMDAVCMGLLAAAATVWEGTSREGHVSTAVIVLQLITLIGEFEWLRYCEIIVTSPRRMTYHMLSEVPCRETC